MEAVHSECSLEQEDLVDLVAKEGLVVMGQAKEIHSPLGRMVGQTTGHIRQRLPFRV